MRREELDANKNLRLGHVWTIKEWARRVWWKVLLLSYDIMWITLSELVQSLDEVPNPT